jgi:16S rRNA (cytidine1402-2'-O)-methyltransferase
MEKTPSTYETGGTLSIVATPIGNLEDITLRALRTLKECDYIVCEDTRVTGKLLAHYQIKTPMRQYDAHASSEKHIAIVRDLAHGMHISLVSDAGTPGVSDPGVLLVARARAAGVRIETIPGPSAVTAAFSLAGLSGNQFTFLGFVPHKKGRQSFFAELANYDHPIVFFESTHRIMKSLEAIQAVLPTWHVSVARELTKVHEEVLQGSASEIINRLTDEPVKQKGEFVIIVAPQAAAVY